MNIKKLFSYTLKLSIYVQFATLAFNLMVSTKNIFGHRRKVLVIPLNLGIMKKRRKNGLKLS